MKIPKISIITVVKDGMPYLVDAIKSFQLQNYSNKEHIIIYSSSSDDTEKYLKNINYSNTLIYKDLNSENLYSSINKGIELSSGEIVGLLHSDDIFFESNTLSQISDFFLKDYDCVYGDILFCKRNDISIIRRVWKSKIFNKLDVKLGWLPPHTSIFLKKKILNNLKYDTKYKISSDLDFVLKIINNESLNIIYANKIICIMRLGGKSTNLNFFLKKITEDIKISKKYFKMNYIYIFLKVIRKLSQLRLLGKKIKSKYLQNFLNK